MPILVVKIVTVMTHFRTVNGLRHRLVWMSLSYIFGLRVSASCVHQPEKMMQQKPHTSHVQHAIFHNNLRAERRLKSLLRKFLNSLRKSHAQHQYDHRYYRLTAIRGELALLREAEHIAHEEMVDAKIHLKSLQ